MIIDIVILLLAVAVGLSFAFAASYLKRTPILIPARANDPVPVKIGAPIPFRFTTYGEIKDKTVHRPRFLLAMIIFSASLLALKLVVNSAYSWNFMMLCTLLLLCGMLLIINLRSTIIFAIFAGIPPLLLSIFGFDNYFWLVFSSGIIPGFKIGLDLSNSYTSLMHSVQDKIAENKYYKHYYTLLKWLPLLVVYQIACYCFPAIDVVYLLQMTSQSLWKYPIFVIVVTLTLNLFWVALPLYRETLTTSNIEAAGEFTKEVRELEQKAQQDNTTPRYLMALDRQARTPSLSNFITYARNPKAYPKNQAVNDFLSRDSKWLSFQSEQITGLLFITIFLLLRLFGETLEATYFSNISGFSPTFENNLIAFLAIASSIGLWINGIFLLGIFTNLPTKKSDKNVSIIDTGNIPAVAAMEQVDIDTSSQTENTEDDEPADINSNSQNENIEDNQVTQDQINQETEPTNEQESEQAEDLIESVVVKNREIIQRAQKDSQLLITCFHDGSDVLLRGEDASILDEDDQKSTEQIDIEVNDISQKLWFKFSAFLVIFGILSILVGLTGHYAIGGKLGDHKNVEFAGSGAEISLKVQSPVESLGGKWTAKTTVSASSAIPVLESYTPQRVATKDGVKVVDSYDKKSKKWNFKNISNTEITTNADLDPFTIYIHTKIFENEKLSGKNIPLKLYLSVKYSIRENGNIVDKTDEFERDIELRILTDNRWIIHEISRYLMATGIVTLIIFALWLAVLSSYLKKKK
ncbi:hypothetical protein [Candidatus Uabimicrobium sp. HlEnr_7]|uniref:hypothetical protein n=1 Tax=Candidatus Uabimicrobium helgolandensis TaxID=3095367 RepID=UPI003556F047